MYAICTMFLHIYISDSRSLKSKRSELKPIIHRLHRMFNVSVAEINTLDIWNESVLLCNHVSNDKQFSQSYIQKIPVFIGKYFKNVELIDTKIEFL